MNWADIVNRATYLNERRIERCDGTYRNIGEELAVVVVASQVELEKRDTRITELENLVNELAYRIVKLEGKKL